MDIAEEITAAAKEVFKELGPCQTELCYEEALEVELMLRGFCNIRRQVPVSIFYKDHLVGVGYIDILLNDKYVIELKVLGNIRLTDEAQVRRYLVGDREGFIINFNPMRNTAEVEKVCLSQ